MGLNRMTDNKKSFFICCFAFVVVEVCCCCCCFGGLGVGGGGGYQCSTSMFHFALLAGFPIFGPMMWSDVTADASFCFVV